MKPHPLSSSVVSRALSALRRWARDAWLARLSVLDGVRGLFGRRGRCAAWEKSGKPCQVRLGMEMLERRETPDDVFGLLHAPMLGTGLAILGGPMLTPAAVLADGWASGRPPLPSPRAVTTGGPPAPGLGDAPPSASLPLHAAPPPASAERAAATPALVSAAAGRGTRTPDDPFADPLGGDWLDAVGKALGTLTPPAANASSAGAPVAGSAGLPTGPVTSPAAGTSFAAPTADDPGLVGSASGARPAAQPAAGVSPVNAGGGSAAPTFPVPGDANGGQGKASPQASAFMQAYGRTQLAFEPNYGQSAPQVNFVSHGPGFQTFLTSSGAVLALPAAPLNEQPAEDVLSLSFVGANPAPQVYATGQLPSSSNYFLGADSSQWLSDVPNYAGVAYQNVYPGVSAQFSGDSQKELEYGFTVAPGADPSQIKLSWQGVSSLTTDQQGDLVLTADSGQAVTETAPVLFQTAADGTRQNVSGGYVLNDDGTVGFRVGAYDATRPLVIDPKIVYSSYLGGSGDDQAYGVAVDASGAAYVTGSTASTNFPTASGYQTSSAGGGTDAFVTKLNAQGSGVVYSTYLGGGGDDIGYGVAVDLSGRAWVVGSTASGTIYSNPFPTTPDAVNTPGVFSTSAFASRLSAAGDQLTYSTVLGSGSAVAATAVAVDALGAAYLTGYVTGGTLPTTSGAFQTSAAGGVEAFVAKLAPTLPGSTYSVTLAYSSYLGGSSDDEGYGVAVDAQRNAYVTGYTKSSNFPTTAGAFKTTMPSGSQASFVAKVNPSGSALSYSTYLSGGFFSSDVGYGVAVDRQGDAFVTGVTGASAFPTTAGAFQTTGPSFGSTEAFVAKLKPDGSGLLYGSYLGGGGETGKGIAVDVSGQATVVGWTSGSSFPVTSNAIQSTSGGGNDAWAAQVNAAGSTLTYATYLGGSGDDEANGVGVDAQGFAYMVGLTNSSNFPTSQGAFQTGAQGGYDAFITKIAQVPGPPVFTAVSPDTGSSSADQVTDTGNVTITGTAAASATVTLWQEGVGVIDTVTASASGLWTSTYFASLHTLPEGTAAFTASQTVAGQTGDPSADWLVTVDETNPVVTLTAPATTASENPLLRVSVSDRNAPANGTAVTIKVYDSTGTTLLNTNTSAATLTDGQASFRLAYTLTPGTTYQIKALVNDLAGNTGTSAAQTVAVASVTTWAAGSAQVLTADPLGGDAADQLGDVRLQAALTLDQSGGSQDGGAALVYNSDSTNVRPIIQATVPSANNAALPANVTATMTWNGTSVGGTYTYSTTGDSPGDPLTLAVQLPSTSVVSTTGRYPWSVSVQIPGQSTQTFGGTAFVVTQDASPFGAGWTFGPVDRLVSIAASGSAPAGMLRVYGPGEYGFYTGTVTFSSPADDAGTLTTGGGLYTYTYATGETETFNSSGYETQWASADGNETLQFRYNGSNQLTGVTAIDGGLTTISYTSTQDLIQTVNSRTTTLALDTHGNLTQITNPDGGTHTFSYDTTTNLHHLTGETFANLQNEWAYNASNGALATMTVGSPTGGGMTNPDATAVSPEAAVGLTAAVGVTPLASETDGNAHTTQLQLDAQGRPLAQYAADRGALTQWARDANGRVTAMTDPLGRTTSYALDSSGYATQQTNPDGSTVGYQYQASFHALVSMTNERGDTTTYAYDAQGHLTSTTDALGDVTAYGYNASGLETSMTDPLTHTSTFAYDADRRLTNTTDPLGDVTAFGYDANGNLLTMTDALGRVTTTHYDVMGRLTSTTNALGGVSSMTYNAAGLQLSGTDANGVTTSVVYDVFNRGLVAGQVLGASTPVAASELAAFDADGRKNATRAATGGWTTQAYDAMGDVTQTTDAVGDVMRSTYDLDGELVASRNAVGDWTTYVYNAAGKMTTATNALGGVTTVAYDAVGDVTQVTDQLGHAATTKYDAVGRVTTTTDPLGNTVTAAYDRDSNVTKVTDADGGVTSYAYDVLNRATMTTMAVGSSAQATSTVAYDKVGNVTSGTDALGHTTSSKYDALNRPTATTDPLSHTTTTAYDAVGNITAATNPLNETTTYLYDQLYEQIQTTDPLSNLTTTIYDAGLTVAVMDPLGDYTQALYNMTSETIGSLDMKGGLTRTLHNAAGQLTAVIDADGNQTKYVYDALGQQAVSIDPLGHRATTAYDAAGDVSAITDADNREQVVHYDADGRLTAATWLSSTGATVNLMTYTYDNNGNQLTASDFSGTYTNGYDAQNRLTSQTDPQGLTLTYQYDSAGRVTQRADSLGGVLTYGYDNANRLTTEQFGGTGMTQAGASLTYDAAAELTSVTRYSDAALTTLVGTTAYGYDSDGRVTAVTNKSAAAVTLSYYDYTYDSASRVSTQTWHSQTTTGSLLSGAYTYSYDATNQLLSDGTATYSYDANGNPTTLGFQTGSGNEITTDGTWTYTYDDAGDIVEKSKGAGLETWYYGYDTLNRLTSIEQTTNGTTAEYTTTYGYDVYGNLMEEQDWQSGGSTTVTYSAYDGGQTWADLNSGLSVTTRYLGEPGSTLLFARIDVGVGLRQVSQDAPGSVRDVWDGTGVLDHVQYAAFGSITSETNAGVGGYVLYDGLREDRTSGTVQTRWRTLLTSLQRWMQPDPINFSGGDGNLNRFAYNDPTNLLDPTGLEPAPPLFVGPTAVGLGAMPLGQGPWLAAPVLLPNVQTNPPPPVVHFPSYETATLVGTTASGASIQFKFTNVSTEWLNLPNNNTAGVKMHMEVILQNPNKYDEIRIIQVARYVSLQDPGWLSTIPEKDWVDAYTNWQGSPGWFVDIGDTARKPWSATLKGPKWEFVDAPASSDPPSGKGKEFVTAVIGLKNGQTPEYLGSVRWGYHVFGLQTSMYPAEPVLYDLGKKQEAPAEIADSLSAWNQFAMDATAGTNDFWYLPSGGRILKAGEQYINNISNLQKIDAYAPPPSK